MILKKLYKYPRFLGNDFNTKGLIEKQMIKYSICFFLNKNYQYKQWYPSTNTKMSLLSTTGTFFKVGQEINKKGLFV
ncbi:hypothetical protein D3C74_436180 [compost metagenome]